jgi:hypothetical protein
MALPNSSNPVSILAVPKRFPWVMAMSLAGAWAGAAFCNSLPNESALGLSNAQAASLLMTAYLGISLLFSLAMMGERMGERGRGAWSRHLLQAGGAALLFGYFLSLGEESESGSRIRFGTLFVAVHLLVAFAPFLRDSRPRAFWQYNQALFVRIATSLIFSGFLFLGFSLALRALEVLMGLRVPDSAYGDLGFLIAGVFNTWFFLAGVPGDFDSLEKQDRYPLSLKILSQYVFIPLVSLNVLILYAYMIVILADAGRRETWPATRIAMPFLAAGLWGILSLLLLHPARGEKEAPWSEAFKRWFYPLQLPPLIFLVALLGQDIFREGLRVDAYLDLVLAFWIAGIAVYFAFGKGKSIKAIPVSLFLLCTFCSFGPWGVIGLPRFDQVRRLEKLMADNGLFRDGRFVPAAPGQLQGIEQLGSILEILLYLNRHGGLESLRDRMPLVPQPYDVLKDNWQLAEFLGLYHRYTEDYQPPPPPPKPGSCRLYAFQREWAIGPIETKGYSFFLKDFSLRPCRSVPYDLKPDTCRGLGKSDSMLFRSRDNTALLTLGGQTISIPLETAMAGLEGRSPSTENCNLGFYPFKPFPGDGALIVKGGNGRMKAAIHVLDMVWEKDSSDRQLKVLDFDLLFGYE